jgi:Fur family peroxide stress response transcriptional regulator
MEKYRKANLKITPQRLALLEYLDGNKNHPSAEQIYNEIKKKFPMTSFATVYKNLEALRKKGHIKELTIDPARRRYDPNIKYHHHLICQNCNKIVDIHFDFSLNIPDEQKNSFDIVGNHIEFYGICSVCREGRERHNQT